MINIVGKNFILNDIEGIIFDKDGTLTDSSSIGQKSLKEDLKNSNDFKLSKEDFFN